MEWLLEVFGVEYPDVCEVFTKQRIMDPKTLAELNSDDILDLCGLIPIGLRPKLRAYFQMITSANEQSEDKRSCEPADQPKRSSRQQSSYIISCGVKQRRNGKWVRLHTKPITNRRVQQSASIREVLEELKTSYNLTDQQAVLLNSADHELDETLTVATSVQQHKLYAGKTRWYIGLKERLINDSTCASAATSTSATPPTSNPPLGFSNTCNPGPASTSQTASVPVSLNRLRQKIIEASEGITREMAVRCLCDGRTDGLIGQEELVSEEGTIPVEEDGRLYHYLETNSIPYRTKMYGSTTFILVKECVYDQFTAIRHTLNGVVVVSPTVLRFLNERQVTNFDPISENLLRLDPLMLDQYHNWTQHLISDQS